ncbi:MAG: FAD-dependent oxidoreductase [Euryarchaeota archaeon]|nr:FAD-dependent oxidoreductase [Euryarchaeota archaeon]
MTVGIIGAGLTGLTLGSLIADCEIVEKNSKCGGLCRSLEEDGFTFDWGGSHIIFSKDKRVLNVMLEKLGDNIVKRRRNTKILYKGNYVKYPFENGLSDLPLQDNFECLTGFIEALINNNKRQPRNFKEWLYSTFGKGMAEKYLIPYNEKIWKYDTSEMCTVWVDGRVPKPPVEDIIKSSLGIATEGYAHQLNFYYPKEGGINALIRSLEHESRDKIIRNFDVKSIGRENDRWIVSNGIERRSYDKIIATQPIFDVVRAIKDVPAEIYNALDELKYNSLITVMLGLDVEHLNDFSWLYIPDGDCLAHRVAFPSNYSKEVAPEGKSAVLAEITYNNGDSIDRLTDDELITRTVEELHKKKIIDKDTVCFTSAKRTRYAYVISDLNYERNTEVIKRFLSRTGIHLVGRFAEFKYLNMDACVRSAMDCAKVMNDE